MELQMTLNEIENFLKWYVIKAKKLNVTHFLIISNELGTVTENTKIVTYRFPIEKLPDLATCMKTRVHVEEKTGKTRNVVFTKTTKELVTILQEVCDKIETHETLKEYLDNGKLWIENGKKEKYSLNFGHYAEYRFLRNSDDRKKDFYHITTSQSLIDGYIFESGNKYGVQAKSSIKSNAFQYKIKADGKKEKISPTFSTCMITIPPEYDPTNTIELPNATEIPVNKPKMTIEEWRERQEKLRSIKPLEI